MVKLSAIDSRIGIGASSSASAVLLAVFVAAGFCMRVAAQDTNAPRAAEAHDPDAEYILGPDSKRTEAVPHGRIGEFLLTESKLYPGYSHKWWLYIPAQYDGRQPVALMVFQDGGSWVSQNGPWQVPVVLDNLIARHALPIMAGVFVDPGTEISAAASGSAQRSNRSEEYDSLDSRYADFLLTEILPLVRRLVAITDDPEGRGIGGHSSGGICAFTVAWQRPDQFRKVFTASGSFTAIRGGDAYPDLVLKTPRKPIRIFQQSGEHDAVHPVAGNWAEANQRMAQALDAQGYDHRFVFGHGSHSPAHAAAIFPDAMRWLWRDLREE
jgi:enterochelin esterase family protein